MNRFRTWYEASFTCIVPNGKWKWAVVVDPLHWNSTGSLPKPQAVTRCGAIAKAFKWRSLLEDNPWVSQTQLAANEGVSQFLVAQHVKLTTLPPEIINFILALDCPQDLLFFSEPRLRPVLSAPAGDQLAVFDQICATWRSKKARDHSKKPA